MTYREPLMTTLKITPGSIIVNDAHIHKAAGGIACVYVDLKSKYAEVSCMSHGNVNAPELVLSRNERTLYCSRSKKETIIEFSDFKGWRIFATDIGRYTLAVCLIKE